MHTIKETRIQKKTFQNEINLRRSGASRGSWRRHGSRRTETTVPAGRPSKTHNKKKVFCPNVWGLVS